MECLSIKIEDSSLSWLYNLLASVFTGIIRDYVCASLKDMLGQQSAVLLGGVNKTAVTYWPFIHKILKVACSLLLFSLFTPLTFLRWIFFLSGRLLPWMSLPLLVLQSLLVVPRRSLLGSMS